MIRPNHPDAKILIIDDQDANIRLMERILKQGGYGHWRSLSDSREALDAFKAFQPDLVLLDLMMPYSDGLSVLQQLKPLTQDTYLPVLVLTADVAVESKRRALAAGAKDFLTKPLDAIEVLLRIGNLLETRFLYRELQSRTDQRIREQTALLDGANDAILVRDMDERILYWNRGAERLYGWTALEAIGQDARQLLYKNQIEDPEEARNALLRNGNWEGEARHVTKDGREIIVAARWTLVRDTQGKPVSRLIINTDNTEKKKLQAQLAQAQRLETVGLLAGGIAHDFNNLLTIIVGYSEVALSKLPREDPIRDLIRQVRKAGERASELTRKLLTFSRRQTSTPVVFDLNARVIETEKMLRRLIGEDIVLTTVLDPELGAVKMDPGQLDQVLMNLAVNARDAMPRGGRLAIETRNITVAGARAHQSIGLEPGPYVCLTVSDTGCGMDESTKARIFEPFFTTKDVGQGTGLGLATVYGIVKDGSGAIEVDSEPGRGTSFRIYLPRYDDAPDRFIGLQSGYQVFPRGDGTVLLVDDEKEVRTLASQALRSAGYEVLEAGDGEEAFAVCQTYSDAIDLLVTDVVMPKMSGRRLADLAIAHRPNLKVLYISGYTDETLVRHGAQQQTVPLLQKPFTPVGLARKVSEMLTK